MTSQDVDRPGPVGTSRRSKITPEREREFFDAVLHQIRVHGYYAVTMEGIAAGTRCSKSTPYRQWGSKPRLVVAALRSSGQARLARIDTGTLAGTRSGLSRHTQGLVAVLLRQGRQSHQPGRRQEHLSGRHGLHLQRRE